MNKNPLGKALVIGASGFLGSHITRQLVAAGRDVRILVRRSSDTRATDHLDIERCYGDVTDLQSLQQATAGCDSIFYCVIDNRAWLRDTTPMYQVNIDGLYNTMDAALTAGIRRFVLASSIVTVGLKSGAISDETTTFNWWNQAPEYIRSQVTAEKRFLEYCEDQHLPGIVCCIANSYGSEDYAPTPWGQLIKDIACGKIPFFWRGGCPSVGISDAASAMILAEQQGRVGERYIIAERWVEFRELISLTAIAAHRSPPKLCLPRFILYLYAAAAHGLARLQGREERKNLFWVRHAHRANDVDNKKARTELNWQPRPIEQSIREAVVFYLNRRQPD
jgi:dihydroflavonol-4-reductase